MAAKRLTTGVDSPAPTPDELQQRISVLRETVQQYLPGFVKAIVAAAIDVKPGESGRIILHQDGFAAGLDDDEYLLLGMAVKYAGLHGVEVVVMGKNRETTSDPLVDAAPLN